VYHALRPTSAAVDLHQTRSRRGREGRPDGRPDVFSHAAGLSGLGQYVKTIQLSRAKHYQGGSDRQADGRLSGGKSAGIARSGHEKHIRRNGAGSATVARLKNENTALNRGVPPLQSLSAAEGDGVAARVWQPVTALHRWKRAGPAEVLATRPFGFGMGTELCIQQKEARNTGCSCSAQRGRCVFLVLAAQYENWKNCQLAGVMIVATCGLLASGGPAWGLGARIADRCPGPESALSCWWGPGAGQDCDPDRGLPGRPGRWVPKPGESGRPAPARTRSGLSPWDHRWFIWASLHSWCQRGAGAGDATIARKPPSSPACWAWTRVRSGCSPPAFYTVGRKVRPQGSPSRPKAVSCNLSA